jgi:uncharacterized membrane protein YccC
VLVYFFAVLFGLLVYWLLGFAMRDIGTWPGPVYAELEQRLNDATRLSEATTTQKQIDETRRAIEQRQQRQKVLRDSTGNSERTMNQLLELQKLTLQKGLTPSADEAGALAESERLFLTNQTKSAWPCWSRSAWSCTNTSPGAISSTSSSSLRNNFRQRQPATSLETHRSPSGEQHFEFTH